jgi:hypothetical protein
VGSGYSQRPAITKRRQAVALQKAFTGRATTPTTAKNPCKLAAPLVMVSRALPTTSVPKELDMKIVGILGILLFLFGGLVLLVGLVVCINTWSSDYATRACAQAEADREKFDEAKTLCGSTTSDCYRERTIGLVSQDDCESRTAFMNRQLMMGIVPAVIGGLLAVVGFFMGVGGFVLARRKKAAVSS